MRRKVESKFSKKHAIILCVVIVIAVAALILPSVWKIHKENSIVATVNGEPVSVREFSRKLETVRADIYQYFYQKYGVNDNLNFWTNSYGGEVPLEVAKKKTLDYLTRTKIELLLAKQKGIMQDISYSGFLKDLDTENKRRAEAVKTNKVIYGPVKYGENEYFGYVISNMLIKLKEKMGEQEFNLNEKGLKDYYETIKDRLYKREDSIKVQKLYIALVDSKGNLDNTKKSDAKAKIDQLKARLDKGEKYDAIKSSYKDDGVLKVVFVDQTFDETSAREDSESMSELKAEAAKLSAGQVSNVIEANNVITVMQCVEKKSLGYRTFDEVKDHVKSNYVDKKYEEMVVKLVKEAKVDINKSVYAWVKLR